MFDAKLLTSISRLETIFPTRALLGEGSDDGPAGSLLDGQRNRKVMDLGILEDCKSHAAHRIRADSVKTWPDSKRPRRRQDALSQSISLRGLKYSLSLVSRQPAHSLMQVCHNEVKIQVPAIGDSNA